MQGDDAQDSSPVDATPDGIASGQAEGEVTQTHTTEVTDTPSNDSEESSDNESSSEEE